MELDHVAIATTDISATLDAAVGELGGIVVHGGDGYGFRWVQARLGTGTTGMTIELLVVWQPEINDFLARFVERHGVGVHHITFKVDDLRATLVHAEQLGLHPVGVNLDNPQWREGFLQPREAHGTVIQLAQTEFRPGDFAALVDRAQRTGDAEGTPMWWPPLPPRAANPITLQRVVIGSPDRGAAQHFFSEFLGGTIVTNTDAVTDLRWPGGGEVRLIDAPDAGVLRLEATGHAAYAFDLSGTRVVVSPR